MTPEPPSPRSDSQESRSRRAKKRVTARRVLGVVAGVAWLAGLGLGVERIWAYQGTPGVAAAAPASWPGSGLVTPVGGKSTLILFAHPKCSCTRASLAELETILQRSGGQVSAWVLFLHPPGTEDKWEQTPTWNSAKRLPGVRVLTDTDGHEADRFGAATSGQVVLYDAAGHLQFEGGITGARGHVGDNSGRAAVSSLLSTGTAELHAHEVYGCGLHDPSPRSDVGADTTT